MSNTPGTDRSIRIALADDQALIRAGFSSLLEAEPDLEVVGEAATGREAVALVKRTKPDVVLMDIRMPDGDGLWATEQIVADPSLAGTHVVVVTTFELDEYVAQAIRAGASGFLVKDTEPVELIRAVRVVAGGEALLSPGVTKRLLERVASSLRNAPDTRQLEPLTDRDAKCCPSSDSGSQTKRSAGDCSSARSPRRPTSRASCRNSWPATAYNWSSSPTRPGSYTRAPHNCSRGSSRVAPGGGFADHRCSRELRKSDPTPGSAETESSCSPLLH